MAEDGSYEVFFALKEGSKYGGEVSTEILNILNKFPLR